MNEPGFNVLLYGAGGAGKTTLLGTLVDWVSARGQKTRIISADGGGVRPLAAHLAAGRASVWYIDQWEKPFQCLEHAVRGYWPCSNVPNSILQPGVRDWKPCPSCGGDAGGSAFGTPTACGGCGKKFPLGTVLETRRDPINGMEEVGAYAFEGLTAIGDLLMRKMKTIDPNGSYVVSEEGFKISGAGRQHYGLVQETLAGAVATARALPPLVKIWTALEVKADDDGSPIYGPDLPGKKLTSRCIPWFTDVLHLDVLSAFTQSGDTVKTSDGLETVSRKLFTQTHYPPDSKRVPFRAKSSTPGLPGVLEPSLAKFFDAATGHV